MVDLGLAFTCPLQINDSNFLQLFAMVWTMSLFKALMSANQMDFKLNADWTILVKVERCKRLLEQTLSSIRCTKQETLFSSKD